MVSSYPAELDAIVMKCLSREPAGRYATCDELSQALEKFAANQGLQVSPLIATRMMRSLFKAEIAAFEAAVKSGGNLVEQVVARMEATAKKASIDDWDSDVASIIVESDKTALTPLPSQAPHVLDAPTDLDAPVVDVMRVDPAAPLPIEPVVVRSTIDRRHDMTLRLSTRPAVELEKTKRERKKLLVPILGGVAVVGAAVVAFAVARGGDPDLPAPAKTAAPIKAEPPDVPEGGEVAKPEPVVTQKKKIEKTEVTPGVKIVTTNERPVKPRVITSRPVPVPIKKAEPKKKPTVTPKKPDKPTAKDLDALPL